jgi:uncharacterized protein GlcG (DUF336 family)
MNPSEAHKNRPFGAVATASLEKGLITCPPREEARRSREWSSVMNLGCKSVIVAMGVVFGGGTCFAQALQTHRIPAALALEAVGEAVASCAKSGYRETAVLIDADGATIASLRGDGAGIHTLDSAHDKAYTSASFKSDTLPLAEVAPIAALAKLPHVLFFGGGVVIKIGDEVVGAIGASGAPGAKLDDNCARAGLDKIRERLK